MTLLDFIVAWCVASWATGILFVRCAAPADASPAVRGLVWAGSPLYMWAGAIVYAAEVFIAYVLTPAAKR